MFLIGMSICITQTMAAFGNWIEGDCWYGAAYEVWTNHVGGPWAITLDECEAFCLDSAQFFENYVQKNFTSGEHSSDYDYKFAC